ncbi:protein FMC1 homolog [Ctenocephalides felis]|uniref:protein FMC1 homolog n=1 Tax=Ctenocephalides felis TaxID=7515 RepID=UPI000E6E4504|nr:protein FMC1 homolog isoform X2 [Ctenocephalides felis]XP_026464743.1 protein FMC1 homolog [Ctenocephalides felis]
MAVNAAKLSTLRGILHELRQASSDKKLTNSPMARYVLDQYKKFKTTEQQWCTAEGEMNYLANTYLCYLKSQRKYEEIISFYKAKGERTVEETAQMVGFKLPHDPK